MKYKKRILNLNSAIYFSANERFDNDFSILKCMHVFNLVLLQVVVITGASSGIGEALAHEFYSLGCRVVLCARRAGELEHQQN